MRLSLLSLSLTLLAVSIASQRLSGAEPKSSQILGEPAYLEIREALSRTQEFDVNATPLDEFVAEIANKIAIPIWINEKDLLSQGINPSVRIQLQLPLVTYSSALRIVLQKQKLDFVYHNEVLEITTIDAAKSKEFTLLYELTNPYTDEDVAALLEKATKNYATKRHPEPVVHLLGRKEKEGNRFLYVRGNKATHQYVESTLRLLAREDME